MKNKASVWAVLLVLAMALSCWSMAGAESAPEKKTALELRLSADHQTLTELPEMVTMTLAVENTGTEDCNDIRIRVNSLEIYTVQQLAAGKSVVLRREFMLSNPGGYRMSASVKDSQGNLLTFDSNTLDFGMGRQGGEKDSEGRDDQPASEGWAIVDLTGTDVQSGQELGFDRYTLEANGLMLVNRWLCLPEDFTDERFESGDELVDVMIQSEADGLRIRTRSRDVCLLRPAYVHLLDMMWAAADAGVDGIEIREGYRSYAAQQLLFDQALKAYESRYTGEALLEKAREMVNMPGTSEFQTGLAMLVGGARDNAGFTDTDAFKWLYEHSWEYGWVFRFPVSGYPTETTVDKSWKTGESKPLMVFRYVGRAAAAVMHLNDFCLEEFVEYMIHNPHIALYRDGGLVYELYRMPDSGTDVSVRVPEGTAAEASTDNMGGVIVSLYFGK